jgi:uncharacterized protein (TIGR03437 family)
MAHITQIGRAGYLRILSSIFLFIVFSVSGFAQQPTCSQSSGSPTVHAEGLAELLGSITLTCSGGSGLINTILLVTVNANITNRLDVNGNPTNIALSGTGVTASTPALQSANTLFFASVQFNAALNPTITISGIRAAIPTATGGGGTPLITGSIVATQMNLPGSPLVLGSAATSLFSSVLNYGVPCLGSPAPATTVNFANLVAAGTASSTVRITEGFNSSFAATTAGADFGVRFLVNVSGYGANSQIYVPDVIVGNRGTVYTSAGGFNSTANGGTYTPGSGQLLLTRVAGADATGNGGADVIGVPAGTTSFSSVTQLSLVNGVGSVTYEVIDANPSFLDSAQIPVFVVALATSCSTLLENELSATLAPVSNVSTATQTDPIPRYIPSTPTSDCTIIGDCSQAYFPMLKVTPASISLNGSSLGEPQTGFITVGNAGLSQLNFTASTTYQPATNLSVANWLSIDGTTGSLTGVVDPSAGVTSIGLNLSASPAALLIPGAYQATVTINAGSAGTITVLVTFNVAAAGPVIQSVVNAANSQTGPVTAGSFAAIYGLNLVPKTSTPATVTFNGFPANISYDGQPSASSPTQINVLVPAALGSATNAGVVATIDGVVSNTFPVSLVNNAPAVFNPGILNQNNSVNLLSAPESPGDIIQIFLTGLATPVTLPVTVNIGNQAITGSQILYAGPSSTPGEEQVNVQVPAALTFTGNSAPLSICVPATSGQPLCSAPVPLYLQ